ncbi:uncharacterized protein TNCV_1525821 [Trichonephila clavipes]|nr:uncharacterized protein TNCV_1525821 [Trichonephila clavipes]
MGEPSNSDNVSNDCLICDKNWMYSSELSSGLGDIIKVTRGISTLKAASAERVDGLSQYLNTREFVYVHLQLLKIPALNCSLPPTADAAFEHFKRVFFQIQTWLGGKISPEEWGWKYESGILIPQTMTQRPVPEPLLKIIFCTCKTECGASCGCRKSGLNCTGICLECNGDSCTNPSPTNYINEIDDDNNEQ